MSSSSQTISLYFGDISSHVGTSFWNIQHNLLNCQESNDFVDIDQMFLQAENINSQKLTPMALFFNMNADSYQWNEYSKFEYSQRSFCTIPIWQNTVPFDICFQGSRHHGCDVDPIINKSIWEDVFIESFRRFAEDCDHLKHINVTSDCFNAFSGITSAYMDSLVDDMLSNSVGMTITCITEDPMECCQNKNSSNELYSKQQTNSLRQLNVPYSIASLGQSVCGSRSVVILPIDVSDVARQMHSQLSYQQEMDRIDRLMKQQLKKEQQRLGRNKGFSSLLRPNHRMIEEEQEEAETPLPLEKVLKHDLGLYIACGFECATGSTRIAPRINNGLPLTQEGDEYDEPLEDEGNMGDVLDVHRWIDELTYHNRFPLLHLEMNCPFSYSVRPPSDPEQSNNLLVQHIHHSLDRYIGASERNDGRMKRTTTETIPEEAVYGYRVLNPFMKSSLSAATLPGGFDGNSPRKERLYTNIVSVRGHSTDNLASYMFSKCILNNSKYLINSVNQRNAGLPLDKSELCGLLGITLNMNNPSHINAKSLASSLFDAVKSDSSAKRFMYCTGVGGIGCDIQMGFYVQSLADTWSTTLSNSSSNSNQIRFQLSKYGFSAEEVEQMHEQLLEFRYRYDLNEFSFVEEDTNDL